MAIDPIEGTFSQLNLTTSARSLLLLRSKLSACDLPDHPRSPVVPGGVFFRVDGLFLQMGCTLNSEICMPDARNTHLPNVACGSKAEVQLSPRNVRFGPDFVRSYPNFGHSKQGWKCLKVTRSGHLKPDYAKTGSTVVAPATSVGDTCFPLPASGTLRAVGVVETKIDLALDVVNDCARDADAAGLGQPF